MLVVKTIVKGSRPTNNGVSDPLGGKHGHRINQSEAQMELEKRRGEWKHTARRIMQKQWNHSYVEKFLSECTETSIVELREDAISCGEGSRKMRLQREMEGSLAEVRAKFKARSNSA